MKNYKSEIVVKAMVEAHQVAPNDRYFNKWYNAEKENLNDIKEEYNKKIKTKKADLFKRLKEFEWILVTNGKNQWTDEFCKLKNIEPEDAATFKGYIQILGEFKKYRYIFKYGYKTFSCYDYCIYYKKDIDCALVITNELNKEININKVKLFATNKFKNIESLDEKGKYVE